MGLRLEFQEKSKPIYNLLRVWGIPSSEFTTKEDILGISLQFLEDHPLEVSPEGTN
jgi:hypothetical protein